MMKLSARFDLSQAYAIERHRFGVVVRGSIPTDDLVALSKVWERNGMDTMAFGIATALGVTFAVCAQTDVEKWEAEINDGVKQRHAGDEQLVWFFGTDTGISSATIFSVLADQKAIRDGARASAQFRPDVPHDPSDFGRCHRLLERFPAWRQRLAEVAEAYPDWKPFVEHWDELTALYLEESPTGRCPKLYYRMQELTRRD